MQPYVPPNLLRIIDALGLHQQFQIVVVFAETLERVGNAGAREPFKDHVAIRFQPGVLP
jgi:hypothetical protein